MVEELVARQDLVGMAKEDLQESELARRERHLPRVHGHQPSHLVERESARPAGRAFRGRPDGPRRTRARSRADSSA